MLGDKDGIYCQSKVFDGEDFGYQKIVVDRLLRGEDGELVPKKGKKQPNSSFRDTENVPLKEDVDEYFARDVFHYAPDAWIDKSKTKIGYEIQMTCYFYEYKAIEMVEDIMERIMGLEAETGAGLKELFHGEN